jgi:hypothetical protein
VATPHVHTRLILGGFGKATPARHPGKLVDLRAFLTVEHGGDELGVITHLSAIGAFEGMGARLAHHGATAGDDDFRHCSALAVIGGVSARAEAIAALAAARNGLAVPGDRAQPSTAAVLMADGSGVAVPVLAYAHPAAQAVHAGIFNASIDQAAGRGRGVMRTAANPLHIDIFGHCAPGIPVDEIVRWSDVKPDRLLHMVARGRVFLNAADMHAQHAGLFGSENAAAHARERFGNIRARLQDMCGRQRRPWCWVRFQPAGQGQHLHSAFCPASDVAALRGEVEAAIGGLVYWQPQPFTPGREVIAKPEIGLFTGLAKTSLPPSPRPGATGAWTAAEPHARPPPHAPPHD